MLEITQAEIELVQDLFRPLEHHCFCAGVLKGVYPGRIFVDSTPHPGSALILTRGNWAYLGGNASNTQFIQEFNQLLVSGELAAGCKQGILLGCTAAFSAAILERVCAPIRPIMMPRLFYALTEVGEDWGTEPPVGFEILRITPELGIPQAELPEDVREMILSWKGCDAPDKVGIGFAAVHQGAVVSHAVIDCIVGPTGEIGLETQPGYRRRGLAEAVCQAILRYAFDNGLTKVIWDCYEHNHPSVRLAEKLGFQLVGSHPLYLLIYSEPQRTINHAWISFECGRYAETIELCENYIANHEKQIPSLHYLLGCAYAGVQRTQAAITYLQKAADLGWDGVDDLEQTPELTLLKDSPEWDQLVRQVRKNQ